ncbi:MAG: hypothetical protein NT169_10880 [Chloroflexi bacterium]|nr:hypothetical protein [Chloroflexota bacterium]
MNVEEDYLDVLQNIEFAIISVYRQQPALVDFDVENAINALITHYRAENREARLPNLNERAKQVYELVETMCEWRMGNDELASADMRTRGPRPPVVAVDVIVACLKRIRKSVQRWNKEGGRRGYLTFIQRFLP